jgi:hypothetical protein
MSEDTTGKSSGGPHARSSEDAAQTGGHSGRCTSTRTPSNMSTGAKPDFT